MTRRRIRLISRAGLHVYPVAAFLAANIDDPMKYVLCALAFAVLIPSADAASFKVLYDFTGGNDGAFPEAGVIRDKAGNLYGTTNQGGVFIGGTVFKLAPDGTETVLHAFDDNGSDGVLPTAGLIMDNAGNLFGTASTPGTVFKLAPDRTETVLHDFDGGSDGINTFGGVIEDSNANLYGTTAYGGSSACGGDGCGIVFEITAGGEEKILYAFQGTADGAFPQAGLFRKSAVLCGTTTGGGANGFGTVFKFSRGSERVVHAFTGGTDGKYPLAGTPIMDSARNLYATAQGGAGGCGTIFRLAPDGTFTLLYSFSGKDGCGPDAGLLLGANQTLYGTTAKGSSSGSGAVFRLAADGTETVLHSFAGADGEGPVSTLIADRKGNLYGTTSGGGAHNSGTVFKLKE
jgi:uncharacterized repeat protein (TIGR03803 family)